MSEEIWTKELCRKYADGLRPIVKYDHGRIAHIISKKIKNTPQLVVVDVASGPGFLLLELSKHLENPKLIVHDSSSLMLEIAKEEAVKYGKEILTCESPAESINLESDTTDIVLCKQLLHEAVDPQKVISEICRIMKKGSKGFIIDFDKDGSKTAAALIRILMYFIGGKQIAKSFWKSFTSGLHGNTIVQYLKTNGMINVEYIKSGANYFISFGKP